MPAHRPAASDDASWVLASWLVLVARLQLLLKEALRKHYTHWKTPKHQDISSCGTSGISKTHAVFPPNPSLLIFSQGSHAKKCVEISSSCNGLTEMAILLPSPFNLFMSKTCSAWAPERRCFPHRQSRERTRARNGEHGGSKCWLQNVMSIPAGGIVVFFFQSHQVEIQKCMSTTTWGWMKGLQESLYGYLYNMYTVRNRNSWSHHVSSILICLRMSHKEASLFYTAMIFEPVLLSHRKEVHPQFTIISRHASPAHNCLSLSSILTTLNGFSNKHLRLIINII